MDLLKAAQSGSLENVEEAMETQGLWTDYEALNYALANGNTEIAKYLLGKTCRVNKTTTAANNFESTPLHKAVELKNVDMVKLLLEKRASITASTQDGNNTPLHLAFLKGLTEIVNLLVEYICQVSALDNCKNDFGLSHLHIASTTNMSEVIKQYLAAKVDIDDAVNIDSSKWAGYTAFHFAVTYKSVDAVKILSNGASYGKGEQKDKNGYTPSYLARTHLVEHSLIMESMSRSRCYGDYVDRPSAFHLACMREDPQLVKTFLEHGAPVNLPVSKYMNLCPLYSPLHFAVESGCKENVKILLDNGANANFVNDYNMTALHLAMYKGVLGIIDLIYSRVEDKESNLRDKHGLSYFHIAVATNDLELVKKMLDEKQIDVNTQVLANDRGYSLYTPLHFAVQFGHDKMVELLVKHGADVNAVCSRGTVMELAFEERQWNEMFDMFEVMLDLGAKADAVAGRKTLIHRIVLEFLDRERSDDDDWTCILEYIDRLVELGCDVNGKDEDGNTALYYASHRSKSNSCVRRLLRNGADVNIENDKGECAALFRCKRCRPEEAVMYHHLQNLKALGLKTNPKLEQDCDELLKQWVKSRCKDNGNYYDCEYHSGSGHEGESRDECLARIHKDRLWEIKKMKEVMLDEKTSLYDFMRLEGKDTGAYAGNELLKSLNRKTNKENLIVKGYESYGYLIKVQYRRSQENARQALASKNGVETRSKRRRVE